MHHERTWMAFSCFAAKDLARPGVVSVSEDDAGFRLAWRGAGGPRWAMRMGFVMDASPHWYDRALKRVLRVHDRASRTQWMSSSKAPGRTCTTRNSDVEMDL